MDFKYDFEKQERKEKTRKFIFKFLGWILALGFAIGLAWAIYEYAIEKTNMVDSSMEATLSKEDIILINKLAYLRSGPERFDVIVFKKDGKEHSFYSIKRVIGLPGEKVLLSNGQIYINGELLESEVITEEQVIDGLASEEMLLDDNEYFVLGDNRNDSEDSRFANIGNVVTEEIVGKAWIRINRFGFVSKLNLKED